MRKLLDRAAIGSALALLSPAALAATLEDAQAFVGTAGTYVFFLFAIVVALYVYFMPSLDKRQTPLDRLLNGKDVIYSVAADALITECTRKMTDRKIGALMVMDGEKLIGIFTERDALGRVLAAGRDPCSTKVCEVMTSNPHCVSPQMTVNDAMALVSNKRFRHFPVVENGKLRSVLSIRDLTHWMVKNHVGNVEELVELAFGS